MTVTGRARERELIMSISVRTVFVESSLGSCTLRDKALMIYGSCQELRAFPGNVMQRERGCVDVPGVYGDGFLVFSLLLQQGQEIFR